MCVNVDARENFALNMLNFVCTMLNFVCKMMNSLRHRHGARGRRCSGETTLNSALNTMNFVLKMMILFITNKQIIDVSDPASPGDCIKNDEFCINNDEFCIKHDDSCTKRDALNMMN